MFNSFTQTLTYATSHSDKFVEAFGQHLLLVGVPLGIGLVLGLPFGLLSSRSQVVSTVLINSFNALRVIPSLAILFIAIPYFGLGFQSAAIALTILVMPPILIGTDVAFRSIDPAILEAAKGMGMAPKQLLLQVEIPLALPLIVAGIKTATVEAIASATLAAFIGAGGFGSFIVLGFSLYDTAILLVGAIPVALLAVVAEVSLSVLQRYLQPRRNSE
ncbi:MULTISPECIES: ABC transporter permease [unclassified Coleofasciculus]|uniref:ABC transporter permease n=1 Tax=unclassified Coleofasciculus TaxID=2692782 RepID=UPI00187E3097|nr:MULTISPECIES: ABC transporter permease [unclassified Coleofasciculus]MBE9128438.1 ABC transporter permease [Coleofasciculus sp. LEGE 07081]MBE9149405.1 ABC transporter permease [Coleofasciculus sp. LEGE 07092]